MIDFLIAYIVLLIFWLIVNCFFYALTIITRKKFFSMPLTIEALLDSIIYIAFSVYPLYYIWELFSANPGTEGWWLIPLIVIGLFLAGIYVYFWKAIFGLLVIPIHVITIFFSQMAAEKLVKKEEDFDYEILSPEGEVRSKHQSWGKTERELARWFVISFIIAFIRQTLRARGEFFSNILVNLMIPPLSLALSFLVLGAIYGIYNLIRKRGFFGENRYVFLTKIFKAYSIIYGLSFILELLFYLIS